MKKQSQPDMFSNDEQQSDNDVASEFQPSEGAELPQSTFRKPNPLQRLRRWAAGHKKTCLFLCALGVLSLLAVIPASRYGLAGLFWQQNYAIQVVDAQLQKPVSSAEVRLGSQQATTNEDGWVNFKLPVGTKNVEVSKKYFETQRQELLVPILAQKDAPHKIALVATGRQVPITVVNKISGQPIVQAKITAADTESLTDEQGKVHMVLPADGATVDAKVQATGYIDVAVTLQVTTDEVDANKVQMVPQGKLYFLSNQSGKIDVVKTNLDGSERQTVVNGTGFERKDSTMLLASQDWRFLALRATRDTSAKEKLYVIDTKTDQLRAIDEGDIEFNLIGWHDHHLVFAVNRYKLRTSDNGKQALKSYDADSQELKVLDQTSMAGDPAGIWAGQIFSNFSIVDTTVLYASSWEWQVAPHDAINDKVNSIRGVSPNGDNKKDYKTFKPTDVDTYTSSQRIAPNAVAFAVTQRTNSKRQFYEFKNSQVTDLLSMSDATFYQDYPEYLTSPSGKQALWTEARDGKNAILIGNRQAQDTRQVGGAGDFKAYGWFTDDYLLLSKEGSELFIMPTIGGEPYKVSNYHRSFMNSIEGGYGGL